MSKVKCVYCAVDIAEDYAYWSKDGAPPYTCLCPECMKEYTKEEKKWTKEEK